MALDGNEVAAANEQRRIEDLSKSQVGDLIGSGVPLAASAVAIGSSIASTGAASLAIAGSIVAGLGIVEWFRKLGSSKVNENLEILGQATEEALNRVEDVLREHGTAIDEVKRRLESDEFRNAMASASLQALRTTEEKRLKRLALILANGVAKNELEPESLDDMMRAAVELKERDIRALEFICSRQLTILEEAEKWPELWYDKVRRDWQASGFDQGIATQQAGSNDVGLKSSLARLAACGFIIGVPPVNTTNSPGKEPYALLHDGKRFYERLQEITLQS